MIRISNLETKWKFDVDDENRFKEKFLKKQANEEVPKSVIEMNLRTSEYFK